MEKGYTIKVLDRGFVRYVDNYGTDQRVVEAARISYLSPSKGAEADQKLFNYLFKMRHTSPFEQNCITFHIKLPLFVQGQMVRHRTQKLNQVSARYSEMKDYFYIPTTWRKQDEKNKQGSSAEEDWNKKEGELTPNEVFSVQAKLVSDMCYDSYQQLIQNGVSREMARMILPQNLYTEIYSQWDLHNLMHFFRLRLDKHAQQEIREYAEAMYKIFAELYPWCDEAYKKYSWELKELV